MKSLIVKSLLKQAAIFLLGFVVGFALVVGMGHRAAKPKSDPANVWCDAPPVDGAGAPAACN